MANWMEWVASAGAAVAVLGSWWRWGRPRFRAVKTDARDFRDAILGREPILHPDTGEELLPAVPGVGARMAHQERETGEIKTAILTLTQTVTQLVSFQQEIHEIEGRLQTQIDEHRDRLARLEGRDLERAMARTETVELLRTMDSAIKSNPNP